MCNIAIIDDGGCLESFANGTVNQQLVVGADGCITWQDQPADTDDQTAAEVPIADAGNYFTSTTVEGALQELGACCATPATPVIAMNDLTDADTATTAPAVGDLLTWNGTNWVPAAPTDAHVPVVFTQNQDLARTTFDATTQTLNVPPPVVGRRFQPVGFTQAVPTGAFTLMTGLTQIVVDSTAVVGSQMCPAAPDSEVFCPVTGGYSVNISAVAIGLAAGYHAFLRGRIVGVASLGLAQCIGHAFINPLMQVQVIYSPRTAGQSFEAYVWTDDPDGITVSTTDIQIQLIE